MDSFVTHTQLLIILLIILLGVGIYSYAMLKHAIELRQRTTQVIEDLTIVQTYIDVELAAKLLEQQLTIDAILIDQDLQNANLNYLNENSNITYGNTIAILNNITYDGAKANTTATGYNWPLPLPIV